VGPEERGRGKLNPLRVVFVWEVFVDELVDVCVVDVVFGECGLVPVGYRRGGGDIIFDDCFASDCNAACSVVGAEKVSMGGVFFFKGVKNAFCEHFESGSAVVFVLVEVNGGESGEKTRGGGFRGSDESRVREFVLFVNSGLSWDL